MINRSKESSRYYPIVIVILILMIILVIRLFVLAVIQHKEWDKKAVEQNSKEIYTSAPRGNIYDRNGEVLATNKQVFTATFNSSSLSTEEINGSSLKLLNLLIENGDKHYDKFPIKIDAKGNFYFTYDDEKSKWLEKNGFERNTSAENAFNALRNRYEIDPKLSRYDAVDEIYKKYGINLPIYVKNMTYTFDLDKRAFLTKFQFSEKEIDKKPTPEKVFKTLRKNYKIDKALSDEDARKIFIIRNQIATNGFTRYIPITVGTELSTKTISVIEEAGIPGVSVVSETKRYYPNKELAANVLGYMGKISEAEAKEFIEKGYSSSDVVGRAGIEGRYEESLRGINGVKKIRVNSSGEYINTISETKPKSGEDVYLTIDINLQRKAEESLKENIAATKADGYPNCETGAVVAIDVKTGDVLAMAQQVSYDPNIFSTGISEEAWESVQRKNPRDPLSPAPLYNIATRSAVQPGSIFKPITAIAALECGLNPNQYIVDKGFIKLGDRTFGCSLWNDYGGTHGSVNLERAIGFSCNYYFYCVGTGKDWGTGASLGYKEPISIDKIMSVAKEFGLGEKSGIQLPEEVAPLPTEARHKEMLKINLWNTIYASAQTYFPKKVTENSKALERNIDTIVSYMDENPEREQLFKLIRENTDVKKDQVEDLGDLCKFSFFNQAKWSTGDEFNISIGQGDNAYTPLQMANYVATLGNQGEKNQVSIVKGVSNEGLSPKASPKPIKLTDKDLLKDVIKGMKMVANSGTLGGIFGNFEVPVAGKTGTAQRAGKINPADEVAYIKDHLGSIAPGLSWYTIEETIKELQKDKRYMYSSPNDLVDLAVKKASDYKVTQSQIDAFKPDYDNFAWTISMAPADEPQIAVSALLIQGGISTNAAPIARDVISEYLNLNSNKTTSPPAHVMAIGENTQY